MSERVNWYHLSCHRCEWKLESTGCDSSHYTPVTGDSESIRSEFMLNGMNK